MLSLHNAARHYTPIYYFQTPAQVKCQPSYYSPELSGLAQRLVVNL